jgi:hypothetical protein
MPENEFAGKMHHLKSITFFIIVCVLFTGLIVPPDKFTDLEKYRLKGSVKSLMEIKYSLAEAGNTALKNQIMFQKYTLFDINGYETESTLYKKSDELLTSRYIFGNNDKPVEMLEYHADGTLNLTIKFKYDEKGYKSEAIYNWADNRIIGEICEKTDYYFDIVQNEVFTRVIYKNDYRGFCEEENYLKPDSSLSFKIVAKYDFRGNKVESAYFHGNDRLSWMTKYTYDRYDNLIESRVFKSNYIAVVSKFKYQFDSYGNWISRNEKRDVHRNILTDGLDTANTVTERTIEYY